MIIADTNYETNCFERLIRPRIAFFDSKKKEYMIIRCVQVQLINPKKGNFKVKTCSTKQLMCKFLAPEGQPNSGRLAPKTETFDTDFVIDANNLFKK